jgi:hypothetical protein
MLLVTTVVNIVLIERSEVGLVGGADDLVLNIM